ncbi:hypothetical protein GlitD10_1530 [Gloeomargarita lithophora Alchichica-D10]|uniref:Uncharacterized protein n=1 Tax=Gloeomargarita lithophora Alchichica-D10 TaxID=1188229 RepID=A0A1J0AD42_9CYAN|nr:DUF6464 family protein [Gloeomargarita lithophora]APB33853.1 hypothetical protein GlitD10_1530 [Gloeomargarita lithophora Alchichica-D10]
MLSESIPTQIVLNPSAQMLGEFLLTDRPQPGSPVEVNGQLYTVLERRHCYQYRGGRYQLHKMALLVQTAHPDRNRWQGHWIIGNGQCKYNAQSELVRCAVNPLGSCQNCPSFEPASGTIRDGVSANPSC